MIVGAEKLHSKQREKENQSIPVVTSASKAHSADNNEIGIVLTGQLKTELAEKVFAKAIEVGYMKEEGSHYKWTESKVLLAYMCGRIYCVEIIRSVLKWKQRPIGNSEWNSFLTPNYALFLPLLI